MARECAVPLPTIESQTHSLSSEPSDAVSARPGQGGIHASDVLLLQALEAGDDDIDAARLAAARVRQCDPTRHWKSDSAAEAAPLIIVPSEVVKGGEDAVEVGA